MADFERKVTVGVDAETAFNFLADPARLPLWVVGMRLEDAIAVDGDPSQQSEGEGAPTAPEATFLPDRKARVVSWSLPGRDYEGSAEVRPLLATMTTIVIRLHLPHGVDSRAVDAALDQTVKNLQRQISAS